MNEALESQGGAEQAPERHCKSLGAGKASWVWGAVAAGASGGLMALCYWPLNFHFLAWVAMVPWLLIMPRLGAGRTWLMGTILGFVFYRVGLDWLFGLYGPIGGATIVGFGVLMGLAFRVSKLAMDRFGTSAMLWAVPLAFVGQEVLRCEGLPLHRLAYVAWGYSQAHNLWIAQIASIGGVYFVSFVLVAFNTAVAYGLIRKRHKAWIPAAAIAVVVLSLAVLSQPGDFDAVERIPVACVQAETYDYEVFHDLTGQALGDPSNPLFVVLPEHTIMEVATDDADLPLVGSLGEQAREHGAFICVGVHGIPRNPGNCYFDNLGLVIAPEGGFILRQPKMVPVPFYDDGNPGRRQEIAPTAHGQVGVLICYDSSFTDVPRRLSRLGAEFLLVPVYNAEDWPRQQRWHQADMAPFRSIELRRCVVRAASSGNSMILDATGRVRGRRSQDQGPGILCGEIYAVSKHTIFARFGYVFPLVLAYGFMGIVGLLTLAQWYGYIARTYRRIGRVFSRQP